MNLPQVIISILLFMVLFFGIGFLLNMLLRQTWIMAFIYPIIVIMIIDKVKFYQYFTEPAYSFNLLAHRISDITVVDGVILISGMIGAILSGIAIRMLRVRGYQMF